MSGNPTTYDTNSDNFKVSPALVLGHLYQQYQEKLYLLATSKPNEYATARAEIVQKVKISVVNQIYKDLRDVLTKGELGGYQVVNIAGTSYVPNYPPTDADSRILSIAKALDNELSEIVDIIIPPFSDILKNRIESKTASNL